MKYTVVIDKNREEEVVLYLHSHGALEGKIESLIAEESTELIGYGDGRIVRLHRDDVFAVYTEDGKLFARTENEKLQLRERLYAAEEKLGTGFVKINQSCIVNVSHIERFDVSVGGSLLAVLKNGYKDYVSRRQLKTVKERIGFKL